jgi:hypothetical protein
LGLESVVFGSTAGAHIEACSLGIEVVDEFDIAVDTAASCSAVDTAVMFAGRKNSEEKHRSQEMPVMDTAADNMQVAELEGFGEVVGFDKPEEEGVDIGCVTSSCTPVE